MNLKSGESTKGDEKRKERFKNSRPWEAKWR